MPALVCGWIVRHAEVKTCIWDRLGRCGGVLIVDTCFLKKKEEPVCFGSVTNVKLI